MLEAYLYDFFLVGGKQSLGRVLGKASFDHLFNSERLDSQQVQDHVISQPELRRQFPRHPNDHCVKGGLLPARKSVPWVPEGLGQTVPQEDCHQRR